MVCGMQSPDAFAWLLVPPVAAVADEHPLLSQQTLLVALVESLKVCKM